LIELGVSGLTSNPTIFKKAIADSADYDADLEELSRQGLKAEEACEKLMIADVGMAADLLRTVFEATNGLDGFASIEVSPLLAGEAAGTVAAAARIWSQLGRPNIMIKVPATAAGITATRELLKRGINVNVTLIFSAEVYERVALAYIEALEERLAVGAGLERIASVASFFVSRVDAISESTFDSLVQAGRQDAAKQDVFLGKVGIANSKVAYQRFQQLFGGERFAKLKAQGARVQRPLWASTGTKNPRLSKTLYVEELAGAHTVNTVPPATLQALLRGANIEAKLQRGLDDALATIQAVQDLGLDFSNLLSKLQRDGVEAFSRSYDELLAAVALKMSALS
jgi:transaldolase